MRPGAVATWSRHHEIQANAECEHGEGKNEEDAGSRSFLHPTTGALSSENDGDLGTDRHEYESRGRCNNCRSKRDGLLCSSSSE